MTLKALKVFLSNHNCWCLKSHRGWRGKV